MEKYGFVYIWHDRKHHRYYVGSHWGTVDDGYICSSRWMRKAYRRRPEDFKRRILSIVTTNRHDAYLKEEAWLKLMKPEELGERYYNRSRKTHNLREIGGVPWNKGKTNIYAEETLEKMRQAKVGKPSNNPHKFKKGRIGWNKGKKGLQVSWLKGKENYYMKGVPKSEETKARMSAAKKGKPQHPNTGMNGRKHSEATKAKIRETKLRKRLNTLETIGEQ